MDIIIYYISIISQRMYAVLRFADSARDGRLQRHIVRGDAHAAGGKESSGDRRAGACRGAHHGATARSEERAV